MSEEESRLGRTPPHNTEAERALLGALILDPERVAEVAERLDADDFFAERHGALFSALVAMAERGAPIDFVSLGETLAGRGDLQKVGGRSYLVELASLVSSSAHLLHHSKIVRENAVLRRLIRETTEILSSAYTTRSSGEEVTELLDRAETRICSVAASRATQDAEPISAALQETFRRIDSASHRTGLTGLSTGYFDLDDMLCGLNAGDLLILAARPSMGKTALALNLVDHAATHQPEWLEDPPSVLMFSLEMGRQSLVSRLLCARARVEAHKLRTGRVPNTDYAELARAAGELEGARIFIDDTPGLSVMAVRSRARRFRAKHGLHLIVIDYLQLMSAPGTESRQQEISTISRGLKDLARELEVPVVALSQLSRAVESRDDKRPQLADLRESGSIEQDADVVMLLYRPEYYAPTEENRGLAELIVAKQRNGPTGTVRLQFQGNIMLFKNYSPSLGEEL